MTPLPDLPLLIDGDSYLIEMESPGDHVVRIKRILVFPENVNTTPKSISFGDLDSRIRRAVIAQINRRHTGKMVHT